jgi:hypothetical protein
MNSTEQLTMEDVRRIIVEASTIDFPNKTIEEVEIIMRNMVGFTVNEAVETQMSPALIRDEVHMAYLCDSAEYPEHPDEEFEYDDPKNDMGFWRTGIRVSPF